MSHIERIGVSLDKELLAQFDALILGLGYPNRSEAIRDLIRDRLDQQDIQKPHASVVAGIFIIYDHHASDVVHKLTDLQHNHLLQIITSIHVHLDHNNCLEIVILKGKVKDVSPVADAMTALKGVKLTRTCIMSTGEKLT